MTTQTEIDTMANAMFDDLPIEQQTRDAFRYCIDTARRQLNSMGMVSLNHVQRVFVQALKNNDNIAFMAAKVGMMNYVKYGVGGAQMNPVDFIHRQIVTELVRQGCGAANAAQAADFAVLEYRRRSDLGKDAFGELLRVAGVMATKADSEFKFVQPKPKVIKRFKS